jgi:DNA-binding beta-propeller fold protein YncE
MGSWAPLGLGFDLRGRLLVTDVTPGRHGVAIFDREGAFVRRFGREGDGLGELRYPNAVVGDLYGRVVVSDSNNGRLQVFDVEGSPLFAFGRAEGGGRLGVPRGLAVDEDGRVHVADAIGHVVNVYGLREREAPLLFSVGSQGTGDGEWSFPNGLALDRSLRLYVTDRENNRVQVWTY